MPSSIEPSRAPFSSLLAPVRARLWVLLGLGALGLAGWALRRHLALSPLAGPSPPERIECHLRPGEEFAFRLQAVTVSTGAAAPQVALGGVLHWRVLESHGAGWLVAAALDAVTVDGVTVDEVTNNSRPEAPASEPRVALAEPFLIDLGRDCRFKRLAFPPTSPARVRSQLDALMRSMEMVLPVAPVRRWSARQDDAMGSYQGHYDLQKVPKGAEAAAGAGAGTVITRRRVRYLASHLPETGLGLGHPSVQIVSSEAQATLDDRGGWLSELSSHDHLEVSLGPRLLASVIGTIDLHMIDSPPLARLAGLNLGTFIFRSGVQAEEASPQPKVPDQVLATLDLKGALVDFQRRLNAGRGGLHDSVSTLAGYLVLKPTAIALLMDELRNGTIDPKLRSAIFLALEHTGTPQAEHALAEGLVDRGLSGVDRMRAAAALADVPHPSQRAVDALLAQVRTAGGDVETEDVSRSALLALGTLDHNSATSQPELAAKVRKELDGRLRSQTSPGEILAELDAVGNSGDEALMPAVERYTDDPSPEVRAHAAGAYRLAEGAADELGLTAWLLREPDPRVRSAIVASLAERIAAAGGAPSSNLVSTAIEWLPQEPDAQVRGQLIRLLGTVAASATEAKQVLIDQFHREQQPELLELIGRFCSVEDLR